jgi:hypothetical protein
MMWSESIHILLLLAQDGAIPRRALVAAWPLTTPSHSPDLQLLDPCSGPGRSLFARKEFPVIETENSLLFARVYRLKLPWK